MKTLPRQIKHRPIGMVPVHITTRLKGSIPRKELDKLLAKRESLFASAEKEMESVPDEVFEAVASNKLQEVAEEFELLFDASLHEKSNGPYHLKNPAIREIILDSWHWITKHHGVYVYAICVMSNHVHVLVGGVEDKPEVDPARMMKAQKGFTSRVCSEILGTKGKAFWETGYYDRDVRDGTFTQVMWYILNNPVSAGLVEHWADWPGTWLNPDFDDLFRNPG
ncbi:transposase [Neolewinella lacunae]|uniref:Transposase n=1 Tax=Neolewinella lacunae TaxID=1517758 RepID=A0A923PR20_9BACT|nr:transposase [Neolewinella lacunae]MBC6995914.1 transposase [Neolewinella lacunae]MDN3636393.1 transposase [Neolewinella lacunae]